MNRVLVVVDMQKDFITGTLGTGEAAAILPRVAAKIQEYRQAGQWVVFTADTHGPDYLDTQEGRRLPVVHCVKGSEGWQLDDSLAVEDSPVYQKPSFGSLQLAEDLAARHARQKLDSIELVGLCTDICVISNALLLKAFLPEVPILVDGACCAGVTPESHSRALAAMSMCHIQVEGM